MTEKSEKDKIDMNYYKSVAKKTPKNISRNTPNESERSSSHQNYQNSLKSSNSRDEINSKNNGNRAIRNQNSEVSNGILDQKGGILTEGDMTIEEVRRLVEMTVDSSNEENGFEEKDEDEYNGSNCVCGGFTFLSKIKA